MALKFSANLSTFFNDVDLSDRFEKAKLYGFNTIEMQNCYSLSPYVIKLKLEEFELSCDLINVYTGANGCGYAAVPELNSDFYYSLEVIKDYHASLNFKKLHILSGERTTSSSYEEQKVRYVESLNSCVEFLENMGVIGLIEPICAEINEKYFLNNFDTAIEILKEVEGNQIKLLLDIFHLHKITGDVGRYLDIYYPFAGHIQVSQDPGRKEPFCDGGVIDYRYVFNYLRRRNHSDYIGLEYFPSDTTEGAFKWIQDWTG